MSGAIRDWELERYQLGELEDASAARVRAALETDPALRDRLARLEQSDREILARHPPAHVAAAVAGRVRTEAARHRRTRRATWGIVALGPALATAAVLVAVVTGGDGPRTVTADRVPAERVKGDAALVIHRRVGRESEVLPDGERCRPGDVLQLSYVPAGHAYGVIVSIDGAGGVTLHYPEEPLGSTELARGTTALPHAYELDSAPSFERFFFLSSDRPISVARVLARAHVLARDGEQARRAPLALGDGIDEVTALVRKQP